MAVPHSLELIIFFLLWFSAKPHPWKMLKNPSNFGAKVRQSTFQLIGNLTETIERTYPDKGVCPVS
jgi:hypothetical protein